ncbi:MAG: TolC family protein [Campylobacterota bacterium]|nr:TolC family protein [Campylobacterota bacterium]
MKMKYYWVIGLLLFSFLEAKIHVLTIDDIVKMALKHSPEIDSSRLDFKGAKQRALSAEGFYLPRVDLSANGGKQRLKYENKSSSDVYVLAGTLSVSQLLYDFGKREGRLDYSKQEAYGLEAQMQQVMSDKIYYVKKSYYDILKIKSIIDVQHTNIELQKKQLYRAKKYLKAGIKTIIDVSDAEVKVEQAQLDLKRAEYELELQHAILEETIGYVPYNGNYKLYSKKLSMKKLSRKLPLVKTPLRKLEAFAYEHRYVLRSSKHYVKGAQSHVKTKEAEYYPSISIGGDYTMQDVGDNDVNIVSQQQGKVGVNVSWNLFSGYQTDASVQEAKIGVLKANAQVQSVKLAIKKQVVESHINLRKGKDIVKLYESISKASLKKFNQAQKRYENELSDYVELQDAQQGYIQSLSDLVNAYYDYFIALAQLDHAIGK